MVCDFGLATIVRPDGRARRSFEEDPHQNIPDFYVEDQSYCYGTPQSTAPEVVFGEVYGLPSDMWSLGVILYEMITNRSPWGEEHEDVATLYERITSTDPDIVPSEWVCDAGLCLIVGRLLRKDPSRRPSINELLVSHVFEDRCVVFWSYPFVLESHSFKSGGWGSVRDYSKPGICSSYLYHVTLADILCHQVPSGPASSREERSRKRFGQDTSTNVIRLLALFPPPSTLPTPGFSKRSRSNGPHPLPPGLLGSYGGPKAKLFPGSGLSLLGSRPRIFLQQSLWLNPFPGFLRLLLSVVSTSLRSRTSLDCCSTARLRHLRRWTTILSWITSLLSRTFTRMRTSTPSYLLCCTRPFLLSLRRRFPRCRPVYLRQKRRACTPPIATSRLRIRWVSSPKAAPLPLW